MKKGGFIVGISLILCFVCAHTHAADGEWSGEAELGFVQTGGNTDTQTMNLKMGLGYSKSKWSHSLKLSALGTKDEDKTSAEKYTAGLKTDYLISGMSYLWGTADYVKDRFSGYSYRLSEALGYGYHLIDTETHKLDLEAGPGARQSELENGETLTEFVGRLQGFYRWVISKHASFAETLTGTIGEEATIITSESALTGTLVGNLAMKASLTIEHTTDVPADTEDTDTEIALTLVYTF